MITVGLKRDGKIESVKFPLVAHDGKAIIGIVIQDAVGEVKR